MRLTDVAELKEISFRSGSDFLKMVPLISLISRISLLSCQDTWICESWFCNRPWRVWSNSRNQTFNWKSTASGRIKGSLGIHVCILSCIGEMSLEVVHSEGIQKYLYIITITSLPSPSQLQCTAKKWVCLEGGVVTWVGFNMQFYVVWLFFFF